MLGLARVPSASEVGLKEVPARPGLSARPRGPTSVPGAG